MAWHDDPNDLQAKVRSDPDPLDIHVHQTPGEIKSPGVMRSKRREMFPRLWDIRGYDSQKHCGHVRQRVPAYVQAQFDRFMRGINYNGKKRVRISYHPHWNRYVAEQAMPNNAWEVFSIFDEETEKFDMEEHVAPDLEARGQHYYQTRNGGVGHFRIPDQEDYNTLREHSYVEHTDVEIEDKLAIPEDEREKDNDREMFDQDLDNLEYYYDAIHRHDHNSGRRRKSVILSPELAAPLNTHEEIQRNGFKVRAKKGTRFAAELRAEARAGARGDSESRTDGAVERGRASAAHEASRENQSG